MFKANPGGFIPPDEVLGRNDLIDNLWRVLKRQSLVLTAERRMGKTSVIKKMVAEPRLPGLMIYQELEGIESPLQFVESVIQTARAKLSQNERMRNSLRRLLSDAGGTEIGGVIKLPASREPDWQALLDRCISDLLDNQSGLVVFFWDEMPMMLHNIAVRSGEAIAMQLLDHLRGLRQRHERLRMVFTGSVGLHNVLTRLRNAGHANDATNDMHVQDVPPLSAADGEELASRLLEGESLAATDLSIAGEISSAVDNIPYFIHHVVDSIATNGSIPGKGSIGGLVDERLLDSHDPWHMRHYQQRISTYYDAEEAALALAILDILAVERTPVDTPKLLSLLESTRTGVDREIFLRVLLLLQQDHYLVFTRKGNGFRFSLVKRAWVIHRGLR